MRRELTTRCAEQQALRAEYESLRIKHETLCAEQAAERGGQKTLPSDAAASQEAFSTLASVLAAARHDYAALADASQVLIRQRDTLQERIAELEAVNKRLVDMVWGRRSERRKDSPGQLPLGFSTEPLTPPSPSNLTVLRSGILIFASLPQAAAASRTGESESALSSNRLMLHIVCCAALMPKPAGDAKKIFRQQPASGASGGCRHRHHRSSAVSSEPAAAACESAAGGPEDTAALPHPRRTSRHTTDARWQAPAPADRTDNFEGAPAGQEVTCAPVAAGRGFALVPPWAAA